MKVYLTAMWDRQSNMRDVREKLQADGIVVTSRWLDEKPSGPMESHPVEVVAAGAQMDLDDIDGADAVIVFSEDRLIGYTTGGRHVELGYAIAKGKPIIVVGPRENVFFYLPQIRFADSVAEAVEIIAGSCCQ